MSKPTDNKNHKVLVRITREQTIYAALSPDMIDASGVVDIDKFQTEDWFDTECLVDDFVVTVAREPVPTEWRDAIPYELDDRSDDTIAQRIAAGTLTVKP